MLCDALHDGRMVILRYTSDPQWGYDKQTIDQAHKVCKAMHMLQVQLDAGYEAPLNAKEYASIVGANAYKELPKDPTA